MHSHPNARLTPISRELLIRRHLDEGVPLKTLAAQAGIGLRSAYKWLARFRDGDDLPLLMQAVDLRNQRCTLRRIANALQAPLLTVGRVMKHPGAGTAQKFGTQGSSEALPVGKAGRHDPCRHQTAGKV